MKLSVRHRRWVYAILAFVYVTGAAWMVLRYGINGERVLEDGWRLAQAWLLRAHGAAAMLTLVAVGSMLAAHAPTAWKLRENHFSGVCMMGTMAVLALTGWLLYYASGEAVRAWSSWLHMAIGAAGPLSLIWHLVYRKRAARVSPRRERRERAAVGQNVTPLRQPRRG